MENVANTVATRPGVPAAIESDDFFGCSARRGGLPGGRAAYQEGQIRGPKGLWTSVDANHNVCVFGDADHIEKSSNQAIDVRELHGTIFCLAG